MCYIKIYGSEQYFYIYHTEVSTIKAALKSTFYQVINPITHGVAGQRYTDYECRLKVGCSTVIWSPVIWSPVIWSPVICSPVIWYPVFWPPVI